MVVLIYCLFRSPKAWPAYAAGSVVAAAIAMFATPEYWAEIKSIGDMGEKTIEFRFDLWKIAWRMFADSPLVGVGPGNFLWNAGDYQSVEQFERYGRSLAANAVTHSLYFELLAELGLAGAIVFGAILYRNYADLRLVADAARRGDGDAVRARHLECAITGGFVGVLVCGASVSILYYSHFWILTALALALKAITVEQLTGAPCRSESCPAPVREWWRTPAAAPAYSWAIASRPSRGATHEPQEQPGSSS